MLTLAPATLPSDIGTVLAALFMLFGVPLILFGLIFLYTGYVRHDAEQYLEELEADADDPAPQDRADESETLEPADERTDHQSPSDRQ